MKLSSFLFWCMMIIWRGMRKTSDASGLFFVAVPKRNLQYVPTGRLACVHILNVNFSWCAKCWRWKSHMCSRNPLVPLCVPDRPRQARWSFDRQGDVVPRSYPANSRDLVISEILSQDLLQESCIDISFKHQVPRSCQETTYKDHLQRPCTEISIWEVVQRSC